MRKGWLGFTVRHNIRVVCVREASGSTLRTCLPLRRHPPPPQDARAGLLIGRHYSKWRLRHIRSVLLAYRERRASPVLLMTREKFPSRLMPFDSQRFFVALPLPPLGAPCPGRSVNGSRSAAVTLKGLRTLEAALHGQHFPEEGFKPPPPSSGPRGEAGDHNVGSQEPWMFRGKLSLLYRGYIFIAM